jgi:hypothetical protein
MASCHVGVNVTSPLLGMKLFGSGAMVELFLLPCALPAMVLFRSSERRVMATLLVASAIAYAALDGALGPPVCIFTVDELTSIAHLHAASVVGLMALVGFQIAGIIAQAERENGTPMH